MTRQYKLALFQMFAGPVVILTTLAIYADLIFLDEEESYNLIVDYDSSFEDIILAEKYQQVHPDINETNFPPNHSCDQKKTTFKIFWSTKKISLKEMVEKMEKDGYRPGTLRELLAFGRTYLGLEMEFPTLALDKSFNNQYVGINNSSNKRSLTLYLWEENETSRRFIGIKK